jgi:hypothetical protein
MIYELYGDFDPTINVGGFYSSLYHKNELREKSVM